MLCNLHSRRRQRVKRIIIVCNLSVLIDGSGLWNVTCCSLCPWDIFSSFSGYRSVFRLSVGFDVSIGNKIFTLGEPATT